MSIKKLDESLAHSAYTVKRLTCYGQPPAIAVLSAGVGFARGMENRVHLPGLISSQTLPLRSVGYAGGYLWIPLTRPATSTPAVLGWRDRIGDWVHVVAPGPVQLLGPFRSIRVGCSGLRWLSLAVA